MNTKGQLLLVSGLLMSITLIAGLNTKKLNFGKVEEIECMIGLFILDMELHGKLKGWLHNA